MTDYRPFLTPWSVHRLGDMITGSGVATHDDARGWVRAVPLPYASNWIDRLRACWWVLTGRAHAVIWPAPGELEDVLAEDRA